MPGSSLPPHPVAASGDLYVSFAARLDADDAAVEVGRVVAECLQAAGLRVAWDGNPYRNVLAFIPESERFFIRGMVDAVEGPLGHQTDDEP